MILFQVGHTDIKSLIEAGNFANAVILSDMNIEYERKNTATWCICIINCQALGKFTKYNRDNRLQFRVNPCVLIKSFVYKSMHISYVDAVSDAALKCKSHMAVLFGLISAKF